jgi:hypothetical protein
MGDNSGAPDRDEGAALEEAPATPRAQRATRPPTLGTRRPRAEKGLANL